MSNPMFKFDTVTREQSKASILIEGLTGKGKSGLALILGYHLAKHNWEKVFDIDTENNSIQLFEGLTSSAGPVFENFKVGKFTPDLKYKPSHYELFKQAALDAGAEVVINDSVSHAWTYEGGILDMIAALKKTNKRYERDSYAAWGDDAIVEEKQKLMQLFRDHRCHVISTVRVKEKMEYDRDENGKTTLTSLGEQQIMQADVKYEPDLVLHMITPGRAVGTEVKHPVAKVIKSRYAILEEGETYEFTPSLCDQIAQYLDEGTSPEELIEKQRQEYIAGVTEYLDAHANARPIWQVLKDDAGYKDVKLADMPLKAIKDLYVQLTID